MAKLECTLSSRISSSFQLQFFLHTGPLIKGRIQSHFFTDKTKFFRNTVYDYTSLSNCNYKLEYATRTKTLPIFHLNMALSFITPSLQRGRNFARSIHRRPRRLVCSKANAGWLHSEISWNRHQKDRRNLSQIIPPLCIAAFLSSSLLDRSFDVPFVFHRGTSPIPVHPSPRAFSFSIDCSRLDVPLTPLFNSTSFQSPTITVLRFNQWSSSSNRENRADGWNREDRLARSEKKLGEGFSIAIFLWIQRGFVKMKAISRKRRAFHYFSDLQTKISSYYTHTIFSDRLLGPVTVFLT